ncbi:T9SS type A sorting domain-containing protein [Flavobacterium sp. J49]|uniref:T9SS type A sorting domain-containing protein n=1 Tax=Flavobacterium sp. J49 TaxID=2718534 RepID=UPI001593D8CF|nr:T9SS type A sorting domain-containing protein [Flavobacterium sp. J49]MBF6642363.1 T9SS type A sorting domain-containing protein [Flavobacterium sp. J49]NIC03609.1 T9SS type A sorting domain-containing protein [Flavobacterium sp. J49]
MKKLLLSLAVLFSFALSNAQGTCATAVTLTTNGTYTTGAINGTYKVACFGTFTNSKGYWYKFTAPSNGEITISSNLPSNDGVTKSDDTRVSVATGLCTGTLTCVAGNDDVDGENYLSELLNVPVTAGTVYLIQWDSRWSALALDFTFNFTPVACARPTVFYLPEYPSATSTDLYWNQTTVVPANYEVDWSTTFATPAGSGTSVTVAPGALTYSTVNIPGMPASSNFRYYVRSNCGASTSTWSGPYYGYLPATLPYSNDFEDVAENNTDGFINFALFNSGATSVPPNYADGGAGYSMYTFNSTTAVSDTRAYFRGVSLQAGEIVSISFKTRLYTATPPASSMGFNLTVGSSQSAAGQATVVQSFVNSSDAAYTTHTATYTAPAAGVYYFGIHNNSAPGTTQTFLFLDTIVLGTNLANNDYLANSFNVFPNPTSDVINVTSNEGNVITSLSIVDINGRIVKSLEATNNTLNQINVSDLNSGVYFININSVDGKVSKKFIKQ